MKFKVKCDIERLKEENQKKIQTNKKEYLIVATDFNWSWSGLDYSSLLALCELFIRANIEFKIYNEINTSIYDCIYSDIENL